MVETRNQARNEGKDKEEQKSGGQNNESNSSTKVPYESPSPIPGAN